MRNGTNITKGYIIRRGKFCFEKTHIKHKNVKEHSFFIPKAVALNITPENIRRTKSDADYALNNTQLVKIILRQVNHTVRLADDATTVKIECNC